MYRTLEVTKSTIDESLKNEIEMTISSFYQYGMYEFNAERILEDICRMYGLTYATKVGEEHILRQNHKTIQFRVVELESY